MSDDNRCINCGEPDSTLRPVEGWKSQPVCDDCLEKAEDFASEVDE